MSALGPAGRFVGEGTAALVAIAWNMVRGGLQRAGVKRAGDSVRAIGATIDQRLEVHSSNRAVLLDTGFEFHQDGMTAAMTIKNLFACQANLDGPIEHESGLCYNDFVMERITFSSETSAIGRGDHANMRSRHFQHFGEGAMDVMGGLRAGPDRQLSLRILDGDRSVLLDGEMGVPLEEKNVLENFVCFGETFFHVAKLQRH